MTSYLETIRRIEPPDETAAARCRAYWNQIAKPLYGMGVLEDMLIRIAAVQGTEHVDIRKKALVIFCADNGVVEEGVSQTGQETTAIVAENFVDGISCAAIMCRRAGVDLFPVDVGMAVDTPRVEKRKTRCGTSNMTKGPAMTRQETAAAIEAGIAKAYELASAGYRIFASGEMGIGNTTTSSAITSVLLAADPEEVTGVGSGLPAGGLQKKIDAIRRAVEINRPDPQDPVDVLAKVGGFEIAALTGLFLGGAACRIPVIIDGFISATAALIAVRLAPQAAAYMLPSHISTEPATKRVMEALGFLPADGAGSAAPGSHGNSEIAGKGQGISPILHAGMHLGEGTGAVALFPLLDMACDIYEQMETFQDIKVEQYQDYGAAAEEN